MAARLDYEIQALVVHDVRLSATTLAANDGSASGSLYTEADPQPGEALAQTAYSVARPRIEGAQAVDVEVRVGSRSGTPTMRDGAELLWRLAGESDARWRGWSSATIYGDVIAAEYTTTLLTVTEHQDAVTIPRTQEVVMVRRVRTVIGGACVIAALRWDPVARTWGAPVTIVSHTITATPCICILPDERLLVCVSDGTQMTRWASADRGATWSVWSADLTTAWATAQQARMACASDGTIRMVHVDAGFCYGRFSLDYGASWSVDTTTIAVSGSTAAADVVALPGTGFGIAFESDGALDAKIALLASASEQMGGSTVVTIDTAALTVARPQLWTDPDGTLWCLIDGYNGASPGTEARLWRSTDSGGTWSQGAAGTNGYSAWRYSGAHRVERVVGTMGAAMIVAKVVDALGIGVTGSVAWLRGGWHGLAAGEVVVAGSGVSGRPVPPMYRCRTALDWAATASPNGVDWGEWALTTTGGTAGLAGAPPIGLTLTTAIGQTLWYGAPGPGVLPVDFVQVMAARVRVTAGGALTSASCALRIAMTSGYNAQIRMTTTGYRLFDAAAAATVGTDAVVDLTSDLIIVLQVDTRAAAPTATAWHWRPGVTVPTAGPTGAITAGAVPATVTDWGHIAGTVAATSVWTWVWTGGTMGRLQTGLGADGCLSRPLGGPVPLPEIGTATRAARIALAGLAAGASDLWRIDSIPTYRVESLIPTFAPSPRREWRSSTAAAVRVAFNATNLTTLDRATSYAMTLLGGNIRTATLSGWDGAAWTVLGTMDRATGLTGLSADRTGDMLRPAPGSAVSARYIEAGELVGGTVDMGGGIVRRIVANGGGWWESTTTVQAWVRVTLTGGEPAAPTVQLVSPRGVLVVHLDPAAASHYSRYALGVPAQTTPDGDLRAGTAHIGALRVVGTRFSRGWRWMDDGSAGSVSLPDGSVLTQSLGPPTRSLVVGVPDVIQRRQAEAASGQDFVGASASRPLALRGDSWHTLAEVLRASLSGEIPVVAILAVPTTSGTTLTEPRSFLYGRFVGSISAEQVHGRPGTSETYRIETVTIREIT